MNATVQDIKEKLIASGKEMQWSTVENQDGICRIRPLFVQDWQSTTLQCLERVIGNEVVVGSDERLPIAQMIILKKDTMGHLWSFLRDIF